MFGPIAELINALSARQGMLSDGHWDLLVQMAAAVLARWHEADHGIWEARRAPRHHVYTKVMCWVALDRALRTAVRHGREPLPAWEPTAAKIREEVLREGWDESASSYTVAYDSPDLDAAVLHIGLSGLLDVNDLRFLATVTAVERGTAGGAHGFPLQVRRRPAGPGGRVPHLHHLADRGLCRRRPDRGGLGPL